MNDVKEFLDHFNSDFYSKKEWITQSELVEYLDTITRYRLGHPVGEFDIDYLSNKYLTGLNFGSETIPNINIRNSDLRGANLSYCIFNGTNLTGSDLTGALLYGANLSEARLDMVRGLPAMACPEEGGFIGWKKAIYSWAELSHRSDGFPVMRNDDVLVKLYIPSRAARSSATTNKCRASEAFVLDIVNMRTGDKVDYAASSFNPKFKYRRRTWVRPEGSMFDANRWNECTSGIHFFMNKQSAIEY